jgi:hypothetical protein
VPLRSGASVDHRNALTGIGGYLLQWGPLQDAHTADPYFDYRLVLFDPASDDPLNATAL